MAENGDDAEISLSWEADAIVVGIINFAIVSSGRWTALCTRGELHIAEEEEEALEFASRIIFDSGATSREDFEGEEEELLEEDCWGWLLRIWW